MDLLLGIKGRERKSSEPGAVRQVNTEKIFCMPV
jgi:hypothetical protein